MLITKVLHYGKTLTATRLLADGHTIYAMARSIEKMREI